MLTGSLSSSASLVDALPYVDAGYDSPGVREAVLALVEEEMKVYRPNKDYLAHLPPLNLTRFQTPLMAIEMKRMDDGLPMEKLDFKKYSQFKPVVNRRKDPLAWEEGFNRVAVLHNYMTNRLANLQLQIDYGPEVWRRYIPTVERQVKLAEAELKDVRNRIQEVNWERKNSQMKAGQKLHELEAKWVELIDKNFQIERSCLELESIIAAAERTLAEQAARRASRPVQPPTSQQPETVDQTDNLSTEVSHMDVSGTETPSSGSGNESADQSMEVHVGSQPEPIDPVVHSTTTSCALGSAVASSTAPDKTQLDYIKMLEKLADIGDFGPTLTPEILSVDSDKDFLARAQKIGTRRFWKAMPHDCDTERTYQYHSIKGVLIYIAKHICST